MEQNSDEPYPDIAQSIVRTVRIPLLPISERRKYVRPDTFRVYIPESEQYDSGIDEEQNEENKKLGETYKTKRIAKVVNKHRNSTGKVFYDVLFRNEQTVEESVPWQLLHDHPDWHIVEEYEYQIALAQDKMDQT